MLKEHLALIDMLETKDVPLSQRRGIVEVLSHQTNYMDTDTYKRFKAQADATRNQMQRITSRFSQFRPPEGVE